MLLRKDIRRIPTWSPTPRWPSREGGDTRAGSDAHMFGEHLTGPLIAPYDYHFRKAILAPSTPRTPETPAPTPDVGNTYHYHPETGHTTYTDAPPAPQMPNQQQPMRRAEIHDHVTIAPQPGYDDEHARVVGHITGGVRVRYGNGDEENLTGDQSHRNMSVMPASYHASELPTPMRRSFEETASDAEQDVGSSRRAAQWRQEMREGPRVGMRFREVHHDIEAPHPYGPLREIVHIGDDGRMILRRRDEGEDEGDGIVEAHPHTFQRAVQADALRPEEPNYHDQFGDHAKYAENAPYMYGYLQQRKLDEPSGNAGYDDTEHREAAATLPGGTMRLNSGKRRAINRILGGKYGLADLLRAYSHRHGDLESVPTNVEVYPNEGYVEVTGKIHHHTDTGDRYAVGDFDREIHVHGDDTRDRSAKHDMLHLDKAHQGHGFAEGFNAQAERHYADWNIHHINLHANLTVGGYAWARAGYDFDNEKKRREMWRGFKAWADQNGHQFPKRDFDRLKDSGRAWEMAEYDPAGETHPVRRKDHNGQIVIDGRFPIGKAYLLSHLGWHGVKHLDAGSEHQRQAQKVLADKASRGLRKARTAIMRGPKHPGDRGAQFWVNGRGRIRYGQAPDTTVTPSLVDAPTPPDIPASKEGIPHWARFGDHSPEAALLHLRSTLLYGDQIVRVAYRYRQYAARIADGTLSPREAARRACRLSDGGDLERLGKALQQLAKLSQWDRHGTATAGLAPNDWPRPLPDSSPFVGGAVAAGIPQQVAPLLGAICLRFAAWGPDDAGTEDDAHNEVAKRLLTKPEAEADRPRSLMLKATIGPVMRPGSRGGHVYWHNGKLRYGTPQPSAPRVSSAGTAAGDEQYAAPGRMALRIMRIGHRVLFRDSVGVRRWGKIISAFGEMFSILPDDAEQYDLLHTVTVPVERVVRVVPEGEGDREAYRVEAAPDDADIQKSLDLEPWPALV